MGRILSLRCADLSTLNTDLLSWAAVKLESFDLTACQLGIAQCNAMLRSIGSVSFLSLRQLQLSRNNLALIFPDLLLRAVGKLERVELSWTNLPPSLVTSLLQMEAAAKVQLELVGVNMQGVPAHLAVRHKIRACCGIFVA